MVYIGRYFERGSEEISLNRDLNKWGIKTNSSKYLGKILGRETKNSNQEGQELCTSKEEKGHQRGVAYPRVTEFPSVPLWPTVLQLSPEGKPVSATKNTARTYAKTTQLSPPPPLTFCDASILQEVPSAGLAHEVGKFWGGQFEPGHSDTPVWLFQHRQFLQIAYLTAANFTITLSFQPTCLFVILFPGLCQSYL